MNTTRPRPHLVPHLVPTSSPDTPGHPAIATSSPGPLSYGGDEVAEPSRDEVSSSPSTSSQNRDDVRSCTTCGCTDNNACQDALGDSCWWVAPNLCSACR